jgi:hypothetical protein
LFSLPRGFRDLAQQRRVTLLYRPWNTVPKKNVLPPAAQSFDFFCLFMFFVFVMIDEMITVGAEDGTLGNCGSATLISCKGHT